MESKLLKSIFSAIFLAIFTVFAIGSGEGDETTEDAEAKLASKGIEVTAYQLVKEINENEIKFMNNYKDKTLEVSGKIADFDTGLDDESVIIKLSGGGMFDGVRCTLAKDQNTKAENYAKGDEIIIKGLCTGESIGNPQMKSCIIIK